VSRRIDVERDRVAAFGWEAAAALGTEAPRRPGAQDLVLEADRWQRLGDVDAQHVRAGSAVHEIGLVAHAERGADELARAWQVPLIQ
jgi:hypothetical protein